MSESVLVVDDNEELAENVAEMLRDEGLSVLVARNAASAEAEARAHGFDLAIVDIRLTGETSGLDLIPRLRRSSAHGEVVLMTGNASLDTAIQAIRSGVYAYLQKPFGPEHLVTLVKRALAQVALKKDKQALTLRLEASEALHREVFETVEACILGLDEGGRIRFANRHTAERLAHGNMSLFDQSLAAFCCTERDRRELARAKARVLSGSSVRDLDLALGTPEGEVRHIRWTLSPLDPDRLRGRGGAGDPTDPVVLACGIDITERLALEQKQAESEAVAAMGTLTTGLAHEIRNPLNAARLQLEILLRRARKLEDEEASRPFTEPAELVREELGRLTSLLDDFLHLARPRQVLREPVRVLDLFEGVRRLEEPVARERGVQLTVSVEPPELALRGDRDKLRQALINLIANAIDALREPGRGLVELRAYLGPEDAVVLEVCDDGPGVPKEVVASVFAPFVTSKQGGTGLGLPIVRKIAQQHGGEAVLLAKPGGGTIARLTVGA